MVKSVVLSMISMPFIRNLNLLVYVMFGLVNQLNVDWFFKRFKVLCESASSTGSKFQWT